MTGNNYFLMIKNQSKHGFRVMFRVMSMVYGMHKRPFFRTLVQHIEHNVRPLAPNNKKTERL